MRVDPRRAGGLALAAGSGVLYGSINVVAKLIDAHPFGKAAVAYLASALFLSPFLRGLRIERRDWPKVFAMGLIGGGLAPLLLFVGLQEAAAVDTGLLLTTEMVATGALAMLFLRERFRIGEVAGLAALLAAALLVAFATTGGGATTPRGALLVLGSAVAWGVDNTVSARLVGSYRPAQLIAVKGVLGGCAALACLVALGDPGPAPVQLGQLALIGVISIAVSSLLFYHALGRVGAARTSAMNVATTALIGAFGGAFLLGEQLAPLHTAAVALVLVGAWLLGRGGPHIAVAAGPA